MKKNIKKYIQGFIITYLIVCLIAVAIYLAISGVILLFTWDFNTSCLVEWNSVWLTITAIKVVNGISVIVSIIAGFANLDVKS